jgi:hypothetical protein
MRDNNDDGREQAGRAPFCAFRPHRHSFSTDMHRALLLPEIVSAVVEDGGLADADLCTLARTCQAFTEPALDFLWRAHEEGEAALAQRMSAELWTIQPLEFEPDEVLPMEFIIDERCWQDILVCPMCALRRQSTHLFFFQVFREGVDPSKLQDEDLGARFAYYAKRLTRVALGLPDSRKRIHSKTVVVDSAVLAVWSQMEHLFPRLRTVLVDGGYLIDPDYACVGFGSFLRFRGLRTLQISAPGCLLEAAAEFRNGIVDACSRITALTLAMPTLSTHGQEWAALCIDMLSDAHDLRVLDLNRGVSIHNDSLWTLATLPVLEELKIAFNQDWVCDVIFPTNAFPGLRILGVHDYTPDARGAINLLALCASNCLEKLEVTVQCKIAHDCMTTLLHHVGRQAQLVHLSLIGRNIETSGKLITQFITSFLEALQPLPLLQTLRVYGHATLSMHVDTVVHVARLCPRLRWWTLLSDRYYGVEKAAPTPMKLSVFLEILRLCPHLIGLPVTINSPDLPSEEAQVAFGVHPCREFSVKRIAATPALWLVIQRLFPQADPER